MCQTALTGLLDAICRKCLFFQSKCHISSMQAFNVKHSNLQLSSSSCTGESEVVQVVIINGYTGCLTYTLAEEYLVISFYWLC